MKILLSIHPEHVEELFAGRKLFEYRRKVPRRWAEIRTIVVYATAPVSAVVGELRVELFHSLGPEYLPYSPTELWSRTRHAAGISEEAFHKYFTGVSRAYAWDVKSVHPYDTPKTLLEVSGRTKPPQGFWYLDDALVEAALDAEGFCVGRGE